MSERRRRTEEEMAALRAAYELRKRNYIIDEEQEQQNTMSLPSGGASGEVLIKTSTSDYDVEWSPGGVPGLPSQAGEGGKFLTTDGADASWAALTGGGDMSTSTYDPNSVLDDAFDMDNMVEGTTTKIFTDTERTKLSGIETFATSDQTGAEIKALYEAEANTNAFTDAEKSKLSGIASNAEENVNADWNAVSGDAEILNKPASLLPNDDLIISWAQGKNYEPTSITRDAEGRVTSMDVTWPDGSLGLYTSTDFNATHEVYDGYTITHVDNAQTVTQAAVTRNGDGAVTAKPALTIT